MPLLRSSGASRPRSFQHGPVPGRPGLPYTSPVLLAMNVEVTDATNPMSVDIHGRILVNPGFIKLVAEECGGLPALAYTILHEWIHYVYSHSSVPRRWRKTLGAKLDRRAHGHACDMGHQPADRPARRVPLLE